MVLIHLKRGEDEGKQFLYEVPSSMPCAELTKQIVEVYNLRLKLQRLTAAVDDLATHGPMKPPEQQGLDDATPMLEDLQPDGTTKAREVNHGPNYCRDPTERRTGNGTRPSSSPPPLRAPPTPHRPVSPNARASIPSQHPRMRWRVC